MVTLVRNNLFRQLRLHIRTRRRLLSLQKELDYYRYFFASKNLSIPSHNDIYQYISSRFAYSAPKTKNNLNILAIYHDYNWEGPSLSPALKAFGNTKVLDWCSPLLTEGLHQNHHEWKNLMNSNLLRIASNWNNEKAFDVIFTYLSGEQIAPEALKKLRLLDAPIVNLSLNDKEAFVGKIQNGQSTGVRDICRYFDLCWTSTEDALEKYVVEGALPVYLPEGANPEVHKPYAEDRIYDVSFVGQCYGNRPAIISRLKEAGVHVEVFGPGWPNGPLSTKEMVRTWSRSKINLGFGGVSDLRETFCLKGRDFEIPMSGGLYLTEDHEELASFYEIGKEIVTYTGFDDLITKIRFLLDNQKTADAIRYAGRQRALQEHSWEKRFDQIFRLMGILSP